MKHFDTVPLELLIHQDTNADWQVNTARDVNIYIHINIEAIEVQRTNNKTGGGTRSA